MLKDLLKIDATRRFLLSGDIFVVLDDLQKKYDLDADRLEELLDLADAVIDGKITVQQMPSMIQEAFGVEEDAAKDIARTLVGHRLLPLENYVPGVVDGLKALGGDPSEYPKFRVEKSKAMAELIVESVSEKYGVKLPDYLNKRLVMLAKAYLEKERAKEPTIKLMMRPTNIGGLELSKDAAENILKEIEKERGSFTSPFEGDVAHEVAEAFEKQRKKDAEREAVIQQEEKQDSEPSADEEESEPEGDGATDGSVATAAPPMKMSVKEEDLDQVTKQELLELANSLRDDTREPEPDLPVTKNELFAWAKRLQDEPVVSKQAPAAPPHDEEKEQLPVASAKRELAKEVPIVSGDALEPEEKEELAQAAKRAKKGAKQPVSKATEEEINAALQAAVPALKEAKIDKKTFQQLAHAHVRGLREPLKTQQMLEDTYSLRGEQLKQVMQAFEKARTLYQGEHVKLKDRAQEKTTSAPSSEQDIFAKETQVLQKRHAAITQTVDDRPIEPVAPSARVSAARTKEEELEEQEKKIDQGKVKTAEEASKPKKAKAKLSMKSAPPNKEKVTDVRFVKTLAGPVDEIGRLFTTEFRRLSSDPKEAVEKIEDKLDLIEETSYEERISAIEAWRKSPLNQLYLDMTKEALAKGVSMTEVASERRNAGKESLSPGEVQAIVAFNKRITY